MTVGPRCSLCLCKLQDIGPLPLRQTVVSASLAAPPREDDLAVSGVGPEGVAIPELGVAPLADSGTELEDEHPTPEDSLVMSASGPEEVCLPGVRPALPDVIDLELQKALLDVSVLPVMVTPIVDSVVTRPDAPCAYPATPLPVLQSNHQDPIPQMSPFREFCGSMILDIFSHTSSRLLAPNMSQ